MSDRPLSPFSRAPLAELRRYTIGDRSGPAVSATPPAVQAPLPARFVQFTLRDLKAERKRLDGFLSLGNEIGRAAEYDEWIAALEAFAAAHGIGPAAQGGE